MSLRRFLMLGAGLLLACGPREIEVARLSPGLDGGFQPPTCVDASDCGPDAFCQMDSCGASSGRCQHIPVGDCPPLRDPVCGCDGVTYWNQCLRMQHGASAQAAGECATPVPCGPGQPACPTPGASCAHILPFPSYCSTAPAQGTCWVLPLGCPPPQPGEGRFSSCGPPTCGSLCEAIRSEQPHARVMCQ